MIGGTSRAYKMSDGKISEESDDVGKARGKNV